MPHIQVSSGRAIELRRFLTHRTRWTDPYPEWERWELWLALDNGEDRKFIACSRSMPARVGHTLDLLHIGDELVGLCNRRTGESVNFTRTDPLPLLRPLDIFPIVIGLPGWLILTALNRLLPAVAALLLVILYYPMAILMRYVGRRFLQHRVDIVLKHIPRRRESPAPKRR